MGSYLARFAQGILVEVHLPLLDRRLHIDRGGGQLVYRRKINGAAGPKRFDYVCYAHGFSVMCNRLVRVEGCGVTVFLSLMNPAASNDFL